MNTSIDHATTAPRTGGLLLTVLVGVLVASSGLAQSQTQGSDKKETPSSDTKEIIQLSPFTVDATRDVGYRANATTAGSRLNTDLKDVAASLTVLTNEFMDDLGANTLADVLSMVAGADTDLTTDVSDTTSGGAGYITNESNQREGEVRVRGLGAAVTTMNFVQVDSSSDRYNIERAELLRGANSILFREVQTDPDPLGHQERRGVAVGLWG